MFERHAYIYIVFSRLSVIHTHITRIKNTVKSGKFDIAVQQPIQRLQNLKESFKIK